MSELNPPSDFLPTGNEKRVIPSGLNVLTILTFIGCALGLLGAGWNFINAKKGLDQMEAAINSPNYENMPALAKKFMSPEALEVARKSYENRVPINLITIIGVALCFFGALQMRQLKKQGYTLYLVGEIIPLIGTVIFIGMGALTGFAGIIAICITLLFILLYTGQRKYLVN
jgi:hypothetical protein